MDNKVDLANLIPHGWMEKLSREFRISRQNLLKVYTMDINSPRAVEIRSKTKVKLKEFYAERIKMLEAAPE